MDTIQKTITDILTSLGKEVINLDKIIKETFASTSRYCKFRKKARYGKQLLYSCENPDLEDPQFGWTCNISNCPYMNNAMDWRANNL